MQGRGGSMSQVVGLPTTHTSLSPIRRGFSPSFLNYKKGCTRLAAASDKVYQLLVHGRWFSPGTPASFTTKTGRHDIAERGFKHTKQSLHYTTNGYISTNHTKFFSLEMLVNIYTQQQQCDATKFRLVFVYSVDSLN